MAYCIASTFSDKTAFQGWEVQRHTLPGPQESIQAPVVSFLTFVSLCLAPRADVILGPWHCSFGNLEVPAAEKATGLRQATMEACRVWKHALGMSLSSLHHLFVKVYTSSRCSLRRLLS